MTPNDQNGQRWRVALAMVLLTGLALRIAYLAMNAGAPDFDSPVLDPQLNDYWARALATGDWTPPTYADDPEIRTSPYGRPPGYPWLLAVIYRVTDGSYLAPRIAQLLAGLVNIFLVFLLTRRLFTPRTGIIAAFLYATYWGAIYFEGELNSPVWEVALALGMACLLLRWADRGGWFTLFLAGVALGAGALMRPNVLLTGVFIALWILYTGYRRQRGATTLACGKAVVGCAVFTAACVLTIAPALARNYVVADEFVLISYYGGVNAYIGNNPEAEGVSPTVPDLYEISGLDAWNCFTYPRLVRGLGKRLGEDKFSYGDASRYFYRRAVAFWREAPWQGIKLTARKAWLFWGPHEISDSKVIYYERAASPLLSRLPGFPFLLTLAMLGLFLVVLRAPAVPSVEPKAGALAITYVVAYFLSILPFFIAGRYRFPVVPFLAPFAGCALVYLSNAVRHRHIGRAASLVAAGVLLFLVISWPLLPYTPNRSTWHTHRGIAHAARGRVDAAMASLEQAVKADPQNDEALVHLGFLNAEQGDTDTALDCYHAAVAANPHNVQARNNLGYEYYRRGLYQQAEEQYRYALERRPEYTLARNNLGNALLEQGRREEALEQFEDVYALDPKDPYARYNMGNVELQRGNYESAVEHYEAALQIRPHNADAANNLGLALLRNNNAEDAVPWFEKALEHEHNHLWAHCNLAIVHEMLGNPEQARKHAARCSEVNPDQDVASQP